MKNKQVKQMIADVVLGGRKAIWYGEESEVYAANSAEQIEKYFGADYLEEMKEGLLKGEDPDFIVSRDWRYWWKPCVCEKAWNARKGKNVTKGAPVYTKDGHLIPYYEKLPMICGVYGDKDTVAQVLTTYS